MMPITIATSCDKFENGKNRALYPSSTPNYLIEDYVIQNVENQLTKNDKIGMPTDCEL